MNAADSPSATSGRQAAPPFASVLRMTAPASLAEPSPRIGVERGEKQRLPEALIERAFGPDDIRNRFAAPSPHQRQRG